MELAKNKKAFFDYEVLDKFEAGIILHGHEVKSIRQKKANLKGSYVSFYNGEAWMENVHISLYQANNEQGLKDGGNPLRKRKLLLQRREIDKLKHQSDTPGVSVIPLKLFLKNNHIKVQIGICRGKKQHDKRAVIKNRETDRQIRAKFKT